MKKITKISLAACIAVAGLTTANAKPLAEAIKDVEVSGSVVYRYNDYNNSLTNANDTNNNYKVAVNLGSKVNDDVKLHTRIIAGNTAGDLGFTSLDVGGQSDSSVDIALSEVYFSYTGLKNTVVTIGKHGLFTPWTVGQSADGAEQTGTGIVVKSTWGPATFIAAYDNQTNVDKSGALAGKVTGAEDLVALAVIGNVGPVALDAWYADADTVADTYTIGAKANFDIEGIDFGIDTRYTNLQLDDSFFIKYPGLTEDNNTFKLGLTAKAGIFNAAYDYTWTDKDGGLGAVDDSGITVYDGWGVQSNGKPDADLHHLGFGVQATDTIHVALNYTILDWVEAKTTDVEEEEVYSQFTHSLSNNLSYYIRFGTYNKDRSDNADEIDGDFRGRLQIAYTF